MKNTTKKVLIFLCLLMINVLSAQETPSLNKRSITDSSKNYSFLVGGHFHGSSSNESSYPAATLLANIDTINSIAPAFLISLGDLFIDINQTYINHYENSLFNKLKMPLYNAVGNHDVSNGNLYEKVYGSTFFHFIHQSGLYIILNTELNDGKIKGEQLDMLKSALNKVKTSSIKNVFIFSHRPIWSENNTKYNGLFKGNTRSQFGAPDFEKEIHPLLKSVEVPVYWISGSLGMASASFFYDKEENSNITYMQTAIRDLPRDALLLVNVKDGKITFDGISLTGEKLKPIESYNLAYWKKHSSDTPKFNYRLLPYLTLQMLKHYFFWIGIVLGVVGVIVLLFVRERILKK